MSVIKIGGASVGRDQPCYVIGEIGINHNGDIEIAKKLIDVAEASGCNAVKFQSGHRIVRADGPADQMRDTRGATSPTWNIARRRNLARRSTRKSIGIAGGRYRVVRLLLGRAFCRFHAALQHPCYKIASATLTDDNLLKHTRATGKPIVLSTGMSTLAEIDHAVEILGTKDLILLHAVSTYPAHYTS